MGGRELFIRQCAGTLHLYFLYPIVHLAVINYCNNIIKFPRCN